MNVIDANLGILSESWQMRVAPTGAQIRSGNRCSGTAADSHASIFRT